MQAKLDKIIDEKIEMMEEGVENIKEEVKEKKDAAMDKVRKAGKSSSKKENA